MSLDSHLNCTYKFESSDNLEAYLQKAGFPDDMVKAMCSDESATVMITKSGGNYTFHTKSDLHDDNMTFTPGVPFEHKSPFGKTYKGCIKCDGNKTTYQSSEKPGCIITNEFDGDKLIITLVEGDVCATRTYRKA